MRASNFLAWTDAPYSSGKHNPAGVFRCRDTLSVIAAITNYLDEFSLLIAGLEACDAGARPLLILCHSLDTTFNILQIPR